MSRKQQQRTKPKNFFPILILSNIGILFTITYISQFIFSFILTLIFQLIFHPSLITGHEQYDFTSNYSTVSIISLLLSSIIMILSFVVIVEKANKIIDYALTNFLLMIIFNWIVDSFPILYSYWIVMGIQLTVIILVSEYISLNIESQNIKLNLNFLGGNL